jgi:hypothetical protein
LEYGVKTEALLAFLMLRKAGFNPLRILGPLLQGNLAGK